MVSASATTLLDDVSMSLTASGATGTGVITITENVYSNAALTNLIATPITYQIYPNTTPPSVIFDQKFFSPVNQVWVVKDIQLVGGTSGTAQMSGFSQNFSLVSVPEPATVALSCSSLPVLGLGLFWARRRRAI